MVVGLQDVHRDGACSVAVLPPVQSVVDLMEAEQMVVVLMEAEQMVVVLIKRWKEKMASLWWRKVVVQKEEQQKLVVVVVLKVEVSVPGQTILAVLMVVPRLVLHLVLRFLSRYLSRLMPHLVHHHVHLPSCWRSASTVQRRFFPLSELFSKQRSQRRVSHDHVSVSQQWQHAL